MKFEFYIERNGAELILEVTIDYEPYAPAITYGPADNWSPSCGGHSIKSITLNGEVWYGTLDEAEQEQLEEIAFDVIKEHERNIDDLDTEPNELFEDIYSYKEVEWESRI